jgi:hypothetical protein
MVVLDLPAAVAKPEYVKQALESLDEPRALDLNPLRALRVMAHGGGAAELRALLVDLVGELSDSRSHRDAQAGRLLLDYYIKKAGSHDQVMRRNHITKPTYFRRLQRGYVLVAQQLESVSEFAEWFPL